MNNIINYDLLDLIGAKTWKEEEQFLAVKRFADALGGYLSGKLGRYLDKKAQKELEQMLVNPTMKEKDLMDFFAVRIPDIYDKLEKYLTEFKILFVTMVYQEKVRELENKYKETKEGPIMDELSIWKQILENAKSSQWDQVIRLLQF